MLSNFLNTFILHHPPHTQTFIKLYHLVVSLSTLVLEKRYDTIHVIVSCANDNVVFV